MRSLVSAVSSWQELKQYHDLSELKEAICQDGAAFAANTGLRSACWKAFLICESLDTDTWIKTLTASRSAYNSLRLHFLRSLELAQDNDGEVSNDPFGEPAESPSSSTNDRDEELRAEILQDVQRTMPEITYFRQPDTQRILLDILFVYCKLNPDLGYRQGMHELLAPILWVVERDAIEVGPSSKIMGEEAVIRSVFDAEHIEHDTFAIFGQVMQNAKSFYEQTTHSATDNPIVERSRRIFEDMLPHLDPELASHLKRIQIVPQIFLMRWIRLLFGREFTFEEMLTVWDVMFAQDPSLELVDEICLVMLLRIRWPLLETDYNGCLPLLLRYPPLTKTESIQSVALDALYLRTHLNTDGGNYLITKWTGRSAHRARPSTPPALQRNITTFSGSNAARAVAAVAPRLRQTRQSSNFEALFQSTAKNIYERGNNLGIGKAVRSAVDEVHKKAQEIRDTQARPAQSKWTPKKPLVGPAAIFARLNALEARNQQLAKLLEGAVDELWESSKLAGGEEKDAGSGAADGFVEKLSVAIAKVQFVQVYLGDPSLSMPESDTDGQGDVKREDSQPSQEDHQDELTEKTFSLSLQGPNGESAEKSNLEEDTLTKIPTQTIDSPSEPPTNLTPSQPDLAPPSSLPAPKPRPPLEQSPYSWMLGQDNPPDTHLSSSAATQAPPPPSKTSDTLAFFSEDHNNNTIKHTPKPQNRGFLFGDADDNDDAGNEPDATGTTTASAAAANTKEATRTKEASEEGDVEAIQVQKRRGRGHSKKMASMGVAADSVFGS